MGEKKENRTLRFDSPKEYFRKYLGLLEAKHWFELLRCVSYEVGTWPSEIVQSLHRLSMGIGRSTEPCAIQF